MFTSMLQAGMTDTATMSKELKELIDDFVNSIYDSIDVDRSDSLESQSGCQKYQEKHSEMRLSAPRHALMPAGPVP